MADHVEDREPSAEERREEEERRLRGRPTLDEEIARKYDADRLSRVVVRGAGRGERLDLATRSDMERLHPGHDFGNVRVFRGALAEEVTARHKADAVTVANTGMILMRESPRSAPGTTAGRALLAHEITHVAQAQRGMHFALAQEGGEGEHEREAEHVEAAVAHGDGGAGAGDTVEQEHARNRRVIERVIELIVEDRRIGRDRTGDGWTE